MNTALESINNLKAVGLPFIKFYVINLLSEVPDCYFYLSLEYCCFKIGTVLA
jgi:hypothetical protein